METTPDIGNSTDGKADLGKRFVASLIDAVIASVLALILGLGGQGALFGIGLLVASGYILLRDGLALNFMDGRSVGKKFMKLRPVRLDGGTMDINTSIRRNWPFVLSSLIFAFMYLTGGMNMFFIAGLLLFVGSFASLLGLVEAILVLTDAEGRRIGDKFAGTKVVASGS